MRPLAIETQVLRDLPPEKVIDAAAEAGFEMAGVWIEPADWTATRIRRVRRAFAEAGISPLDAEVIRISGDVKADQVRLLEIAGEIGIPNVIAISLEADRTRTVDTLCLLAEHARGCGTSIVLEFAPFSTIPDVASALDVVAAAGEGIGILPDPLHLRRSGGEPSDLSRMPPDLIRFAQICDAGEPPPSQTAEDLLWEARHARREIGAGMLPLKDYLAALPANVPLSNETRSLEVEAMFPDPYERANVLARRMRDYLMRAGE